MGALKGYYAYLATAGGILLELCTGGSWVLRVTALMLVTAGAHSLRGVSRWYQRASVTADVTIVLEVVFGPKAFPCNMSAQVLCALPLAITGCMLILGVRAQFTSGGRNTALEWVLVCIWGAGVIMPALCEMGLAFDHADALYAIAHIVLIAELFRAQKEYLSTEGKDI